jgi:hypothetical protein
MKITARELNRATLDRQLLLQREPLGAVDAVRRVVAVQAQTPASPYLALCEWPRGAGDVTPGPGRGARSEQVQPHDHAGEPTGDRVRVSGLGEAGSFEE